MFNRRRLASKRAEIRLLRDAANTALGALSVETYEQRLDKKRKLEMAADKLEAEVAQLERERYGKGLLKS